MNQVKKTSVSDDKTRTSFKYLKNSTKEFFRSYPDIFDSDSKEFFKNIAAEKENIDYKLLLKQILPLSGKTSTFLQEYGGLYNFWTNLLLKYTNFNDIKL